MSLVAYGDSSSDSEVEEGASLPEDKKSDVRKLLGLLPPPKGGSNKHPVRISLPTLQSGDDSDDEGEGSPQAKRVKIKGGASRLTALLPQPKAASKRPETTNKPSTTGTTTRSMVPYTLSKRRQESLKAERVKARKAKPRRKSSCGDGGSDSDNEPVSFFSHLEDATSDKTTERGATEILSSSAAPLQTLVTASRETVGAPRSGTSGDLPSQNYGYAAGNLASSSSLDNPPNTNPAPSQPPSHQEQQQQQQQQVEQQYQYQQQVEQQQQQQHHQHQQLQYQQPVASAYHSSWTQPSINSAPTASPPQPAADDESGEEGVSRGGPSGEVLGGAGPGITIDQEALRRLAGGNTKRKGREEALNNIVDILGDDVMEDVRVYQRHYGEDPSITKLYKVDNSKLKTPSGQQKRKHQITWLAHDAKERELELQKQWAVGQQARMGSRSKYGF